MKTIILALILIAFAGCQEATSTAPSNKEITPDMVSRKAATMLPDGTCGSRQVHDSLVLNYVTYGSFCPVPADSMRKHADGSSHATQYGAGVAYQTWETNDGNCEPRAWAISNVVNHAACFKNPPRYLYDTAYDMPAVMTWGM